MASASTVNPQTFNRYTYALNNPYKYVDPSGMEPTGLDESTEAAFGELDYLGDRAEEKWRTDADAAREASSRQQQQQSSSTAFHEALHQQTGAQNAQQGQAPQNPTPIARPSQKLPGCIFDISITNNGLLNSKQLQAMEDEISRVFVTAGQEINFVSSNANYYLNINAVGANYTNNSDAVGLTPLNGSAVTNNGRVFVDRLTASATRDAASSTAFNQNSKALAVGLGRAGSHEISHYLLQQNYDSSGITGVMHSGFKGSEWFGKTSEGLWKFTPAQIKQLNSLCGR